MASIDRVIEQLQKAKKNAERRGDYSEVYRLENKIKDAKKHKSVWF